MNLDAAIAALEAKGIKTVTREAALKQRSRDYFWYSPVLKDRLDHVVADFLCIPASEEEIIEILRVCYAYDVPVTTRGAGTGNYGQAMPLAGGCVMHVAKMNKVKEIHPGRVICEPGVLLKDIDAACIADSGQEIRMFSSTWSTATIGGFIAGGSGGVGSIRWGSLRDPGNILRLRVVTMEEEPRVIDITGEDLHRVSHAYGTNGIITEVEIPLTAAYDWEHIFVTFKDFDEALRYSYDLGSCDGLLLKELSVYEAPITESFFTKIAPHAEAGDALVAIMVAPQSMAGWRTFTESWNATVIYESSSTEWEEDPGPAFEYGWNHTTLRALQVDPNITYLQIAYGTDNPIGLCQKIRGLLSPECLQHVEVTRMNGKVSFGSLTLVNFTNEERLDEIIAIHEENGAMNFNPHRYTLEEGGRQSVDERQLEFKREADPKGLLNPGKMIAWDDPDWTYEKMYAWPGLQAPKTAAE